MLGTCLHEMIYYYIDLLIIWALIKIVSEAPPLSNFCAVPHPLSSQVPQANVHCIHCMCHLCSKYSMKVILKT